MDEERPLSLRQSSEPQVLQVFSRRLLIQVRGLRPPSESECVAGFRAGPHLERALPRAGLTLGHGALVPPHLPIGRRRRV